jgi:type I restriction enzyme R subunit
MPRDPRQGGDLPHTEADTRRRLIDRDLGLAGWNVHDPTQVIQELDIHLAGGAATVREPGATYEGHQFADYALLVRGTPAAVIEAKKTSRDAGVGQEQAKQYAEALQRIHGGPAPFALYTNGHDRYFWDLDGGAPAKVFGYPSPLDLGWMVERRGTRRPLSVELINPDIAGRGYQIEGVRRVLESVEAGRRKFLMVMATGTGKTRVATALVDVLQRARWAKRVLFLVDRLALQEQALGTFKEHMASSPRWPEEGERIFARDRRIYVTTYPTMLNLIQAGTTPSTWISPFFFDLVVADESHRSIYNIYREVVRYFHALTLGLTATPRDHVDHDTFALFDCPIGDPTYAYGFDEAVAHEPPYLCEFEVLNVRSRFQVQGIHGPALEPAAQEQLALEGFDPETIDFEGTDLERKVSNAPTNALIIREFMEESIKDPTGTLPGKSILFACSVRHARALQDIFDQLYPEHRGRLARVLTSDDSRVHGRGGLLDQFKNQDMPRVAISVDMLDTGVDVREVVNLVFAKPVYSYVKFWQMIGRGTRVLEDDPARRKPWCPEKDRFLIIDCWGNFEYFRMEPRGREPGTQVPLPVRLFRARVDQLATARAVGRADVAARAREALRADLDRLPANNVVVQEGQATLAAVARDAFWAELGDDELAYLRQSVAPLLRAQSGVDFKALRFEMDVVELGTAFLSGNQTAVEVLREAILEQVRELPLSVNVVARERTLIEAVLGDAWWEGADHERLAELASRLAPLMRFRQERPQPMLSLNLADLTAVRERIVVGPDGRDMAVAAYRSRVEDLVRALLAENPVLQRIQAGEEVSESDLMQVAALLRGMDPTVDEALLRKAYDARSAGFLQLLRHVLGVAPLERWSTVVAREFDRFIAEHTTYTALQLRFLQTLRTFVLRRGGVERRDLVDAPFTQLHPQGVRGVFPAGEIEEILRFVAELAA